VRSKPSGEKKDTKKQKKDVNHANRSAEMKKNIASEEIGKRCTVVLPPPLTTKEAKKKKKPGEKEGN